MLADSLGALGHATQVAYDGPSAIGLARSFRPTIALLDLGLPVMDGLELARRLRDELHGDDIVLVAITGYAQAADRARTEAGGFAAHFVKPVDVMKIESLIHQRQKRAAAASKSRTGD